MDKETKEAVQAAVQEKLDSFKSSLGSFATAEDLNTAVKKMTDEVSELAKGSKSIQETVDTIKAAAEKQGLEITKLAAQSKNEEPVTIAKQLEPLAEQLKEFTSNPNAKSVSVNLSRKTTNITLLGNIGTDYTAFRLPGIGQLQFRRTVLRDLFMEVPVGANSHGQIYYTDQLAVTRGAAAKAEGLAAPTTSDITWQGYVLPLEEIKDSIKVSRKAMDNTDFIAGEIQNFIMNNLRLKVDYDLLLGDGATPNIYGIDTRAGAYAAGSYASTIQAPNLYDLANVIDGIIAKDTYFKATDVVLSMEDYTSLFSIKDLHNQVFMPPYARFNEQGVLTIKGMRVHGSSVVAANTMYVGDFNFAQLFTLGGVQLQFGYVNDDFTKGLVTLLGWETLAMLIKTVNQGAFKKVSDINAAISGLQKSA